MLTTTHVFTLTLGTERTTHVSAVGVCDSRTGTFSWLSLLPDIELT